MQLSELIGFLLAFDAVTDGEYVKKKGNCMYSGAILDACVRYSSIFGPLSFVDSGARQKSPEAGTPEAQGIGSKPNSRTKVL